MLASVAHDEVIPISLHIEEAHTVHYCDPVSPIHNAKFGGILVNQVFTAIAGLLPPFGYAF